MRPNGPAVRAIRRAQKVSLRALAQQTGLNRGYLSRVERGLIRRTAGERVQMVADALNVPLEAITHEQEEK